MTKFEKVLLSMVGTVVLILVGAPVSYIDTMVHNISSSQAPVSAAAANSTSQSAPTGMSPAQEQSIVDKVINGILK